MIDAALLPTVRAVLEAPARRLVARGITADQVSLAGFGVGLLALPALWLGWFPLALALILLNRIADGLDGIMARKVGATDRGAFLDIALDFVFYATVPLGFALAAPENALAAAVLICAFVGTGSSFLAFAVIAAKRGLRADAYPAKGIYYLGGLTEGTETIVIFVLMCLFPAWFVPLAYGFALACALTTVLRWLQGWRAFSDQ
ncbi:CDP-alcohol phosphatidyltransferase family protein [Pseudorhodobacter sp. E13]|uniref:CDP-alcohol phosphatidyltransferase family protein n=1 Tax=Pseudorhodobacter sp. E13 TaxID=2487931 RepID=UPI000F8DD0B6|nr:CDP-alcohol phosphatidyltransferase family protein [Pseudorhodobacter sp. E13]RUS59724.1 CDP-alcohol phosphatidyltransferase family protein [Pseudorhodobacter sp. E13]